MQDQTVDTEASNLLENSKERMVSPETQMSEQFDQSLRPERLKDYIGQKEIKENLEIYIGAAKKRKHALDHVATGVAGDIVIAVVTDENVVARSTKDQIATRTTNDVVLAANQWLDLPEDWARNNVPTG